MTAPRLFSASRPYLGPVATCGLIPDNTNTGANQLTSRTFHWACEEIRSIIPVYANFFVASHQAPADGSEHSINGGVAAAGITCSVEQVIGGTRVQGKFSGSVQGSIPAGGLLVGDAITCNLAAGQLFAMNQWFSNTDGIAFCGYPNFNNQMDFGTTATDKTMSGTPASQAAAAYAPVALLGMTTRETIALIGDSRCIALGDTPDTAYVRGYLARSLAGRATVNLGVGSDAAHWALTNYTNRGQLAGYCSHVIGQYGINDIFGLGRTAAQAHADIQSFLALPSIAGKPTWWTTLEPIGVTGTYTSDAGQTAGSTNAAVQTFNATMRAGIAGIRGVIDTDKFLESATKSGVFSNVLGAALTTDGAHANRQGNLLVQSAGIVHPGMFVR